MEHIGSLVRQRARIVKDQSRCKNRIWHLLMYNGLETGFKDPRKYWSSAFIEKLRTLTCSSIALRTTLDMAIEEYLQVRKTLKDTTKAVRKLSRTDSFSKIQEILQSTPGIGT